MWSFKGIVADFLYAVNGTGAYNFVKKKIFHQLSRVKVLFRLDYDVYSHDETLGGFVRPRQSSNEKNCKN